MSYIGISRKPVTDDVDWPLYTKEQPQYFLFNADKGGLGKGPRATACAFWNDFLPKLQENSGRCCNCSIRSVTVLWFLYCKGEIVNDFAGSHESPCEAGIVGAVSSQSEMQRPVISTYISAVLIVLIYRTVNFKKAIDG